MFKPALSETTSPAITWRRKPLANLKLRVNCCHLLATVALVLLAMLASGPAHALLSCNTGSVNKVLQAGFIAAPANPAIGSTVGTIAPDPFQMNCHLTSNAPVVSSATLYADFATTTPLSQGFTDVYQTGVPGLGVRYRLNSSQCGASNIALANNSVRLSCPFTGAIDDPLKAINATVTAELVAIGPIAAGATTLSTVPAVTIVYSTSVESGTWTQSPLYTGAATGKLTRATCSASQTNVAVVLPTADTRAFSSGVGAVAAPQAFSLSLACSAGATVSITLSDSVNPTNQSSALQLTADSTAKGIGIQVLNPGGTPVNFGPDSAVPGNTNQWPLGASPNGPLKVPLTARYVRTGAVSAGTVKALATFTMSYQ